jgi:HPt (histidine-containing phosphotransfer) domain-containing protein
MDEIRQAYLAESQELLASLEDNLLRLEQEPTDSDALNAIFRAAHTIKGGAGIVECDYIVEFTHVVENALDSARDGHIQVDAKLIELLLASGDQIARLLEFAVDPEARPDAETLARGAELLAGLHAYAPNDVPGQLAHAPDAQVESSGGGMVGHDCWHISIRFGENVLREGMDPLSFLRYLAGFRRNRPPDQPARRPARGRGSGPGGLLFRLRDRLPCRDQQGKDRTRLRLRARFLPAAHPAALQPGLGICRADHVPARGHNASGRNPGAGRRR